MLTLMSGTGINVGLRLLLLLLLLLFYLGFLFTYSENKLTVMHLHFLSKLFKPLMCQGNRARLIGLPRNWYHNLHQLSPVFQSSQLTRQITHCNKKKFTAKITDFTEDFRVHIYTIKHFQCYLKTQNNNKINIYFSILCYSNYIRAYVHIIN